MSTAQRNSPEIVCAVFDRSLKMKSRSNSCLYWLYLEMRTEVKQYYLDNTWQVFYNLLAPIERSLVYTIALERLSIEDIAFKCLKRVEDVKPCLEELEREGIVTKYCAGGLFPSPAYFLNSREFEDYCVRMPPEKVFKPQAAIAELIREFHQLARLRVRRLSEIGVDLSIDSIESSIAKMFCLTEA
jgi:hypothetical protein